MAQFARIVAASSSPKKKLPEDGDHDEDEKMDLMENSGSDDIGPLLGLPELPQEEDRNSINDDDVIASADNKLQLLPPKEASDSVARFHKDPEQPALALLPPPSAVSPVQFVGQVFG